MVSPPKPWERGGASALAASAAPAGSSTLSSSPSSSTPMPAPGASTAAPSSSIPAVPERPTAITQPSLSASTPYSRVGGYGGMGSYGGMGYGGTGGYGGYGGYSGYGGMNSMYSGGMYSGGMYGGGYGGGMYGAAPLPFGAPAMPGQPTLTQTLESTTQHTFALLHGIVQTFGSVAQMLESTFVATHSSFFAMAGVADQLAQLRGALGSVLGIFGLIRWLKGLLTGKHDGGMGGEFKEFINGRPVQGPQQQPVPRPSRKPLIMFLIAVIGIPYAMHRLFSALAARAPAPLPPLDPASLTFARALYPFTPSSPAELGLKDGEIVAIMAQLDPRTGAEADPRVDIEAEGVQVEWWKGRTRDGREGWFPKKWVEVIQRKTLEAKTVD